jgi:hypothetical protein
MGIFFFAPVETWEGRGELSSCAGTPAAFANDDPPGIAAANKPVPVAVKNFRRSRPANESGRFERGALMQEPPGKLKKAVRVDGKSIRPEEWAGKVK